MAKRTTRRKKSSVTDETREAIKNLRLLDDVFMSEVLVDNIEGVQDIVNVCLEREDIVVESVEVQKEYRNFRGRGVKLDVLARDKEGKLYNIEIQRDSSEATPERVRYHLSALDWNNSKPNQKFTELGEIWVIFIVETPRYNKTQPFATLEQRIRETNELVEDGRHVRFVNAAYIGNDKIGKLMADFRAKEAKDMYYQSLAKRAKQIKETEEGIERMSDVLEELVEKRVKKEREKGRKEGIKEGIERGEKRGMKRGMKKGMEKGMEKERIQTLGVLLAFNSPDTLMHDPKFVPLGYTLAEINAAMAVK